MRSVKTFVMKKIIILIICLLTSLGMNAQGDVTGKIIDSESKEGIIQASVALLKTDSTLVAGTVSAVDGSFKLKATKAGSYLLRVTYVGYTSLFRKVSVAKGDVALGSIPLSQNAILLKGAEVAGQAKKVVVVEDTFIYNAAAYRTPEGSVVEELVKRIPGAEVDDEGNVKINGKDVKKVYVDGKEFFNGDTKTALKNIPTSVIEKIKAYDEKSDLAKVTGIDDGEETTVLDFGMKRGMNRGTFGNIDLSGGTKKRFSERAMGAMFKDGLRVMAMGNMENVGGRGFGRGGGGGRNGDNISKSVGVNINYDNRKGKNENGQLKIDGSVRHSHSDGDTHTVTSSQNFVSTTDNSFSNSISQNFSKSNSWNGNIRLEWKPDTMTNIQFRPNFSWSENNSTSSNRSATFNDDPFSFVSSNPLDSLDYLATKGIVVNGNEDAGINYSNSKSLNGELQLNRKLNSEGRNITLSFKGSTGSGDSKALSMSDVELFQKDSAYYKNRWNLTPSENWNYSINFSYSEPIFKATFLQFSYNYEHRFTKNDRSTYDYGTLGSFLDNDLPLEYGGWNTFFNHMGISNPTSDEYLSKSLSKFSQYSNNIHTFRLMFRMIREKFNLNIGARFTPQNSTFTYRYQNIDTVAKRSVFNWSPQLNFRYRFSKVKQLRIQYNGSTSQPSMTQLLPVTDDSNPLNITMGNPDLKPSYTQNFRLFYNNYVTEHSRAIMANVSTTMTSNSIATMVTYDPVTGGRTSKPENINGDWSANAGFMFNTSLDSTGYWNVNTHTDISYRNDVGYVSIDNQSSQKNTTRTMNINERLAGSYRNDWLEVELNGSMSYSHSRNMLQPNSNHDTWQFSYGGDIDVQLPWGTRLNTSMRMSSRRGYSESSMNTNELIWNAQVSHSFLTGKSLTVMLQFYDLLNQQSSFSRTISATSRTDTEFNAVNSYAMLHVIYRFNLFGNKDARQEMRNARRNRMGNGEFQGPPPGMGEGPGGGGGGFGGGGRPGGF